jgi:hypothetical protein
MGRDVVAGHGGREAADAAVAGGMSEMLAQQLAESASLPVVGDRDRRLRGLQVIGKPHEAADRDQAAYGIGGRFRHQCHMIAAVHFREIPQLRPAEAALGCEEAPLRALRGEAPEPVGKHSLVIGADGPDQYPGSVWKAFDHAPNIISMDAELCEVRHARSRAPF